MGGSNGGAFASAVSTGIAADALILHISRGLELAFKAPQTPPPTAWLVARQDDTVTFDTTELNLPAIKSAEVPYLFIINEPTPLAPTSLTRIPGLTEVQSTAFFDAMGTGGLLDACSMQLTNPDDEDAWLAFLANGKPEVVEQVRHQLLELHAGHTIFSDFNKKLLAFLDMHVK
jgi:hypothetical protein